MPLSTDTTLNFNSSVGYSFNAADTEFTAGGARLKESIGAGDDTIITPTVTPGATVNKIALTLTERVGYYHLFAVAFDTIWKIHGPAGWEEIDIADISTRGMGRDYLERIRNWPDFTDFAFGVFMIRATGGGTGLIDLITIYHGSNEFQIDAGEPDGTQTLEPCDEGPPDGCEVNMGIMPDYILQCDFEEARETFRTDMGYEIAVRKCTQARRKYSFGWGGRLEMEKDEIVDFIRNHHDEAFIWTPPGFGSSGKFIASEPSVKMVDIGVWEVSCQTVEVFPQ